MVGLEPTDFEYQLTAEDIKHVSAQLLEHGLIKGIRHENVSEGLRAVSGQITAHGIDVIEGAIQSPISIHFVEDKSINVSGSQGVVIGNSNEQTLNSEYSLGKQSLGAVSGRVYV